MAETVSTAAFGRKRKTVFEKATTKRKLDAARNKTRINIGVAFERWRQLREQKGLQSDAMLAVFLLDSYFRTTSESKPEPLSIERSSSTDTCASVPNEYLITSSTKETHREMCAAPSLQSSENGKEPGRKDASCQRSQGQDERMTSQLENKENRDIQDDEEEFITTLSVGDGQYLVDLGSSSEFIVDEECIFQLFKSCWECNRRCKVRKSVKGLKLIVNQSCCFCHYRRRWTNLAGDDKDDGDVQVNGKDAAHGQTDIATSPSSNTS